MAEIGVALEFDRAYTSKIATYLREEGLLIFRALGGIIGISHNGIREVEAARATPERATHHFPPAANYINIGTMVNSNIQQASPEAIQKVLSDEIKIGEIIEVLQQVRNGFDSFALAAKDRTDPEAELDTVEAQMRSSSPQTAILHE